MMTPDLSMRGRVAVVTGGGGAICGAIARHFAAADASVAVWDLSLEKGEEVAAAIMNAGGTAVAVCCDVLKPQEITEAVRVTEARFGAIDVLVNGAGGSDVQTTTAPELPFSQMVPEALMHTVCLNYLSAVLPSQAVATGFAKRKRGVILNVASVAGIRPLTRAVAYSNGKAALISFTQWLAVHMAQEYSANIRVNALAPGFVLTEQNRFLLVDESGAKQTPRGRRILETVPMARYGQAEEMTGAALWLVSDAASYVTGAVIPVDGGLTAFAGV